MSRIVDIIERAAASYRRQGFWDFVKAASVFLLKECQILPLVMSVTRRRRFRKLIKEEPLKLHLGCGSVHLDGYINTDIQDWAGACDLTADAGDLHMFKDKSVDHIFNHALLEHIPPWDTGKTLKEWSRVLKPGRGIQIEVPDLERIFQDWLVNKTLGEQEAIDNIFGGNKAPNKVYSRQDHLTGFTYDRLTKMMSECSFTGFTRLEHPKYHHILVVCACKNGA